ncbi:MAG: hypothetical protein HC771_24320 [Synechococcales cyanobacterium CRU_2_2]|nr:hypothetical protein [Synechococcales cyanobacterium CRU_2_2]
MAAKIIGHSEGNRQLGGGKNASYQSHVDPGNGAANKGSFSAQGSNVAGMTPEQADAYWNNKLKTEAMPRLNKAAAKAGVELTEKTGHELSGSIHPIAIGRHGR